MFAFCVLRPLRLAPRTDCGPAPGQVRSGRQVAVGSTPAGRRPPQPQPSVYCHPTAAPHDYFIETKQKFMADLIGSTRIVERGSITCLLY